MSKQIDPNNMSREDVEYVRQRPNLHREFEMNGLGDPLSKDYPGLNFEYDDEDGDQEKDEAISADVVQLQEQVARLTDELIAANNEIGVLRTQIEELTADKDKSDGDPDDSPDEDESDDGDPDELPESKRWNSDMKKKELIAVIEARNADYDDDEKITFADDKNDTLIAALEADDRELYGDES